MSRNCLNSGNQHLVDFLQKEYEKVARSNREQLSNVIRRAMRSIQDCNHLLQSSDDCIKLRGIGDYLAGRLKKCFPNGGAVGHSSVSAGITSVPDMRRSKAKAKPAAKKPKKQVSSKVPKKFENKWAMLLSLLQSSTVDRTVAETSFRALLSVGNKSITINTFAATLRDMESMSLLSREISQGKERISLSRKGKKLATECVDDTTLTFMRRANVPQPKLPKKRVASSSSSTSTTAASRKVLEKTTTKKKSVDLPICLSDSDSDELTSAPVGSSSFNSNKRKLTKTPGISSSQKKPKKYGITPHGPVTPVVLPTLSSANTVSPIHVGEWELVLLLDNRELVSRNDKEFFYSMLMQKRVKVEKRALPLGDFAWIIRNTRTQEEHFYDYIIERKQISDFVSSIKDGRYVEQKFRLNQCGLPRRIYLVEGSFTTVDDRAMRKAIQTAMAETLVISGIMVEATPDASASVNFLARLHKLILSTTTGSRFDQWRDRVISDENRKFSVFKSRYSKGQLRTVGEIFAAQLKQLKGCSGYKAAAILDKYPTPTALMSAYGLQNEITSGAPCTISDLEKRRSLLAPIVPKNSMMRLGPKLSKLVCDFFCLSR